MTSTKKRDASEAELDADGNSDIVSNNIDEKEDSNASDEYVVYENEKVLLKSMTPFRIKTYQIIQDLIFVDENITRLKLCDPTHFFNSMFDCVIKDDDCYDNFSAGVSIGNYYADDYFDLPLKSAVRKKNMEIVKFITESIPVPSFEDILNDSFKVLIGKLLRCAGCALANDYIEGYNYLQEFVSTRKNQLKELIKRQTVADYNFKGCSHCLNYINENTCVYPVCGVFNIFDDLNCVKVFEKIECGSDDEDSVKTSDKNDDDSVSSIEEMGCLVSNHWILMDGEQEYRFKIPYIADRYHPFEYQTSIEDLSYIIKYGVPPDTVCPTYGYDVEENVLKLKLLVLQMKNDLSDFEKIATLNNVPKSGVSRYIFLVKCGLLRSRENWEKQNTETNDWNHDEYTGYNHYNFSRSYMPYLVFYRHILYLQMSEEDKIKEKEKWQELLGHVYCQGKLTTNDFIVCFNRMVPEYRGDYDLMYKPIVMSKYAKWFRLFKDPNGSLHDMSSFYEDAVFSTKDIQDVANHYKVDLSNEEVDFDDFYDDPYSLRDADLPYTDSIVYNNAGLLSLIKSQVSFTDPNYFLKEYENNKFTEIAKIYRDFVSQNVKLEDISVSSFCDDDDDFLDYRYVVADCWKCDKEAVLTFQKKCITESFDEEELINLKPYIEKVNEDLKEIHSFSSEISLNPFVKTKRRINDRKPCHHIIDDGFLQSTIGITIKFETNK